MVHQSSVTELNRVPKPPALVTKQQIVSLQALSIITHNINGKNVRATNHMITDTINKRPNIVCWQITHTDDETVINHTNNNIRHYYIMVYRNLTNQEKADKESSNGAKRITNSEGIMIFISAEINKRGHIGKGSAGGLESKTVGVATVLQATPHGGPNGA